MFLTSSTVIHVDLVGMMLSGHDAVRYLVEITLSHLKKPSGKMGSMQLVDPVFLGRLIQLFDSKAFVELGNNLLIASAAAHGVPRSCLATNLHITEPDGGIDARCVDAPTTVGRLIPRPYADYQFKAGSNGKSAKEIVTTDIVDKPRVLDGLRQGHAFVYIASWDRGDKFEDDLFKELVDRTLGFTVKREQIVFIGNHQVVGLVLPFPPLVAQTVHIDLNLVEIGKWTSFKPMSNPYQSDEVVQGQLNELRERVEIPRSITRIVGAPGNGKTRLVLEALKGSALSASVFYAQQVGHLTPSFVTYLEHTPDVQCTVVVDEVNDNEAETLAERFSAMPEGVRLVTIGFNASLRPRANSLQVGGLSPQLLAATIRTIVPGIDEERARSIASECHQSPKLAVLFAQLINEDPTLLDPQRLLADGEVQNALDRYLPGIVAPTTPSWQALSTTALLMRLGWTEEADCEADDLFRAVGLDPTNARREVEMLHEQYGIAPLAGRFRYLSPAILADHLAARNLNSWTRERLQQVLGALSPTMADSFARRIRRLSSVLSNRKIVEEVILGDQGPFRTLADLESQERITLMRHLAGAFPEASLTAMQRIIGGASIGDLRAATQSRRDTVWALEELLWPAQTFERAADLLFKLALAENERFSNNATGLWVETFQTMLGHTAADAISRSKVLSKASISENSLGRQLAAQAIGSAFKMGHISRGGMPPSDVQGMPTKEWQPSTYKEWSETLLLYLDVLGPLLTDLDPDLRQAAAVALGNGLDAALRLPAGLFERWLELARSLIGREYSQREQVLTSVGWAKSRLKTALTEEASKDDDTSLDPVDLAAKQAFIRARFDELERLEDELVGDDFSSQFRWAASETSWGIVDQKAREEAEQRIVARLKLFAARMLKEPQLLEAEWEWLLEEKAWGNVVRWIQILGRMDQELVLEPVFRQRAETSSTTTMWLSLYYLARAIAAHNPLFVDERLSELRAGGAPPLQIFDLLFRVGYNAQRLNIMRTLFESGELPSGFINQLAYNPWGSNIPPLEALQLAKAAATSGQHAEAVIPFVSNYLFQTKSAIPLFSDFALSLLMVAEVKAETEDPVFNWSRLALIYVAEDPTAIARAALLQIASYGLMHQDDLIDVIQRAWEVGDKENLFRELFAEWLSRQDFDSSWYVQKALKQLSISDLGTEFLIEWVASDPETRAGVLADVIGAPGGRPSELHAALLDRFEAYGVGSAFSSSFMSGMFMGSFAEWTRSRLESARHWLEDKRPAIREWARGLVTSLEEQLKSSERREEEERFRY